MRLKASPAHKGLTMEIKGIDRLDKQIDFPAPKPEIKLDTQSETGDLRRSDCALDPDGDSLGGVLVQWLTFSLPYMTEISVVIRQ